MDKLSNGILLVVTLASAAGAVVALVEGRWLNALVGALMSIVWFILWWGFRQSGQPGDDPGGV